MQISPLFPGKSEMLHSLFLDIFRYFDVFDTFSRAPPHSTVAEQPYTVILAGE